MTCKWIDVCPLRKIEKEDKISDKWKEEYCESEDNWKNCKRYQMEERGEPHQNILPNGEEIEC
ncbi:MAG: uracil-DNA glycosylase [Candidatus Aenigmatarchaeota archaeon]